MKKLPLALPLLFAAAAFAQDDHADTCAAATLVLPSVTVEAAIETPDDTDFLFFNAVAGRHYVVYAMRPSAGWSSDVSLVAADCESPVPAASDDGISYFAIANTPVYIRVRTSEHARHPTGAVRIGVTDTGPWTNDDHANTSANATPLATDGSPIDGELNYWLDDDYFRVAAQPGSTYRLTITDPAPVYRSFMVAVVNAAGETLFDRQVSLRNDEPSASLHIYTPPGDGPGSGDLFVRVHHFADVPARYRLSLTHVHTSSKPDDHADACKGATPAIVGEWIDAAIESPGDIDTLAYQLVPEHRYALEFSHQSDSRIGSFRAAVTLRGDACEVLDETYLFSTYNMLFRARSSVAFISLAAAAGHTNGSFKFRLVDLGTFEDDHADGPTGAVVISADGTTVSGTISDVSDRDAVVVELAERTTYALELRSKDYVEAAIISSNGSSSSSLSSGWTADPEGWVRTYCYIPPGGGGRHTILLDSYTGAADWTVRMAHAVSYDPAPDPGDDCTASTPLPLNTWTPVTIDTPGDSDYYTFSTQIGRQYRVEFAFIAARLGFYFWDGCRPLFGCYGCDEHLIRAVNSNGMTIQVVASTNRDATAAQLRITDAGPVSDDHAEGPEGATPIAPGPARHAGEVAPWVIEYDTFALQLTTPGRYTVRLSSEISMGVTGSLFASDGFTGLGTIRSYGGLFYPEQETQIIVAPEQTGVYFLSVNGYGEENPVRYEVELLRSCRTDFNRDGIADSRDFFDFLYYFFLSLGEADFNVDRRVDARDFFDFVDAFLAGCPN